MKSKDALISAYAEIDIPFQDCDPMQVVWHGNYARYLEEARRELLRKIDYDYLQMQASGFMWPIIDMRLKYVNSAYFSQLIRVDAYLKEYESRLKIDYIISDVKTGQKLTKAYTIQVAVDIESREMQFESPKLFIDKIQSWLS
ncbi:acyl-CoA thioesterase [Thalassotalea sp. 1_MG-2023]|uniref:acyl-CoA thioesterase n=1 Tax=Thalassotalea sp. 1_MG-2023 TaxID=3062680 RepID=UPI0026E15458|nr:acyl-CoA thioesterase [Thalassotalea sp. 1_MG-2023]MDO6426640.1 acyl-CoA thioesterase [Thalassotalea sp. 1_MG-2023]